jgi:hypothetical protein
MVIGSLLQAENPKSEARISKQTCGLNKPQNPKTLNQVGAVLFWTSVFRSFEFVADLDFRASALLLFNYFATSPAA